jgi:hypothetical protein
MFNSVIRKAHKMAKAKTLTADQWNSALTALKAMGPAELKRIHIKQTKMAIKDMPELADQLKALLAKQQAELKELEAAE